MPITVKLDDLLHARRMTLTELAERIDITLANLSILKTGKARAIRFSTLDAICEALSCQPGDILRFEPENGLPEQPVAVRKGSVTGAAVDVPVFDSHPAVFTNDGTKAIVVHAADNTLVTASSPLQPGENVYLYATGLGAVDNTPPTGAATPSSPLARTRTLPTVTIGGQMSIVRFAGLAPDLAGVYQVNLAVPINIPSGEQDLVLTLDGKPSPTVRVQAR